MTAGVRAVFVYGTLQPGAAAWSVLEPWVTGDPVPAQAPGTLYDTGWGYPAACFGPDTPGTVRGVVVQLHADSCAEALAALDRYEGSGYRRIVVDVGGIEAFTYEWIGRRADLVPLTSGIWPIS